MSHDPVSPVDEIRAEVAACRALLDEAAQGGDLERARQQVFGRKGALTAAMKILGRAEPGDRRELGQLLNRSKQELQAHCDALLAASKKDAPADAVAGEDVTLPGRRSGRGALHPLTQIEREILRVFGALGFEVAEGPEIEDEFHNFIALNIPEDHPARDEGDNFYLDSGQLLRSQTSTVQIRTMQEREPPIRIVAPGRVFRPDAVDATHHYMFHQVEGLAVDKGLSMKDLKATLLLFFRGLFGDDVGLRLRPSFFPFTEPSAEVDVFFPDKDSWVEIGGCGMVDPAVFEAVDLDPDVWTGFAFGLGLERIAMRHFRIPDIRLFTENDSRFLTNLG